MSENNVEKLVAEANKKLEKVKGERGEIGEATASLSIKKMWRANLVGHPSLKRYARQLMAKGDALAKDWFAHKRGSMNAQRTDANKSRASLERQATKASRRKRADGNKTKAKTAEVTAVKQ
jgi:hypothetical protein